MKRKNSNSLHHISMRFIEVIHNVRVSEITKIKSNYFHVIEATMQQCVHLDIWVLGFLSQCHIAPTNEFCKQYFVCNWIYHNHFKYIQVSFCKCGDIVTCCVTFLFLFQSFILFLRCRMFNYCGLLDGHLKRALREHLNVLTITTTPLMGESKKLQSQSHIERIVAENIIQ